MARYIDADKVMEEIERIGGHNLCEWETIGVKALIDRQPTADVAPKSEVERLEHLRAELSKEIETLKDNNEHLAVLLAEAKSEVAREIFEEIEWMMLDGEIGGKYPAKVINPDKYAELKKKYTEGDKEHGT